MSIDKQQTVKDVVSKVTGIAASDLKAEQDLSTDLGIDSPKALEILVELEERLDIDIPEEDAARMETLGDMLDYVAKTEAPA